MDTTMDKLRASKTFRAAICIVLAFALMIPSQALAATTTYTVKTTVEDYEGDIETLTVTSGEVCGYDPTEFVDDNGESDLVDLKTEMYEDGYELVFYDEDTGDEFDFMSTVIKKNTNVIGKWEKITSYEVTVVYDDGSGYEITKDISVGKSWYQQVGSVPSSPKKEGYTFLGWYDQNGDKYDFYSKVTGNTVVTAKYSANSSVKVDIDFDAPAETLTGTCYIGSHYYGDMLPWGSYARFNISDFSGALEGTSGVAVCVDPGSAVPSAGSATYVATLVSVDYNTGRVVYDVVIYPNGAATGDMYTRNKGGYQRSYMSVTLYKTFGGKLKITKASDNTSITADNDCYSLEGAVFGVYNSSDELVDTLTTDADGVTNESVALPVGTYTVKEIDAPEGYALSEVETFVNVSVGTVTDVTVTDTPQNDPADILLYKYDGEKACNALNLPQGSASLEGAQYTVKYYDGYYDTQAEAEASGDATRTWVFETNKNGYIALNAQYLVSGDDLYLSSEGLYTLPLGTYVIYETKAPTGYDPDETVYVQKVTSEGSFESIDSYQAPQSPEPVKRGDVEFVKTDESSQKRLANIPFTITSNTTGESHVIVTDENGYFSSSSSYTAHTANTNKNDEAYDFTTGTLDESKLSSEYGLWFCQNTEYDDQGNIVLGDELEADDENGALPYDTYTVQELACSANEGLQLVSFTVVVTRDGYTINMGTVDDPEASIATTATDASDGDKIVAQDDEVTIVDRVAYSNLIADKEYVLDTQLVVKSTGDVIAYETTTFTADSRSGYVDVEITVDTMDLVNEDLVVYEVLSCDSRIIAEHEDIDDADQTVTVKAPEIGTTATDAVDGDHYVTADPNASVVDTVAYTGLVVGKEYTMSGTLMNAATGEPLVDAQGNEVVASTTFTPEKSSGTVDVVFTFDASLLDHGTALVAFEKLYKSNTVIATHEDIEDEGQTVTIDTPRIGTTAADGEDGDKIIIRDPEASIVDTVSYTGLLEDVEYVLHGELMKKVTDATTGEVTAEAVLDASGEPVTVDLAFTPDDSHGNIDVTFEFDASGFEDGDQLVVYETLYRDGSEICDHKDAEDIGQTVTVVPPELETTALDGIDGDKNVVADPEAVVVDTISYTDVVVGKEYVATGTLYVQGMVLAEAEAYVSEDVYYYYNSVDKAWVVLEAYDDDTFVFSDEVYALADSEEWPEELVLPDPEDIPEASIEAVQIWMTQAEADAYGLEVVEDAYMAVHDAEGNEVVASTTFTPEDTYGTVDVTFEFDASLLAGKTLVAFEDLSREGIVIATHSDIEDEGQTVIVVQSEIGTSAVDGLDGDKNVVADGTATIVDTVSYTDLLPGESYVAAGIVMNKATGLPLLAGEGSEEITDEELASFMNELAVACGFGAFEENESGNMVYVANDAENADPFVPLDPDYETLTTLLEENANIVDHLVIASAEFEPEYADGSVDVTFEFDASNYLQTEENVDTVVYELLYKNDVIIAAHADIEDEGQTTTIVPTEIGTEATDASDGDHTLLPSTEAVVVDTVSYTNLIPGKEYTVEGVLMDKSTGEKLIVNGEYVTGSTTFVPNEADGTVEVEFTFDSTELTGSELVVFEYLYKDGIEVAAHTDIADEAQTVTVEEQPEGSVFDKTGDFLAQYWWVIALVVLAAAGATAYGLRQRKLGRADGGSGEVGSDE